MVSSDSSGGDGKLDLKNWLFSFLLQVGAFISQEL
jgi:hypothetical protein